MTPNDKNPNAPAPDSLGWQETLSAYVDGELPAEEAGHVRARLESDEPSRRLVDELTKVSEAVRSLPRERAPADLAPTVLQATQRGATSGASVTNRNGRAQGASGGGFTIGRSPRGWMFAGAAIAAALLIMALTPDANQPDMVAKQDASGARREPATPELAPAPRPAEREPDSGVESLEAELALSADRAELSVRSAPLSDTFSASGEVEELFDTDAPRAAEPTPIEEGLAVAPPVAASARSSLAIENQPAENRPVVVRVNLRPEAFQNRFVDEVLGANGIRVEATPASLTLGAERGAGGVRAVAAGEARGAPTSEAQVDSPVQDRGVRLGRERRYAETRSRAGASTESFRRLADESAQRPNQSQSPDEQDVEIVVLMAPQSQVQGVLSDLNQDVLNCSSIEVESPASESYALDLYAGGLPAGKQELVAESLRRYSRSGRPVQQITEAAPQQQQLGAAPATNSASKQALPSDGVNNAWAYKAPPTTDLAEEQTQRRSQLQQLANQSYYWYAQQEQAQERNGQKAAPARAPGGPAAQPADEEQVPVVLIVQAEEEAPARPQPATAPLPATAPQPATPEQP